VGQAPPYEWVQLRQTRRARQKSAVSRPQPLMLAQKRELESHLWTFVVGVKQSQFLGVDRAAGERVNCTIQWSGEYLPLGTAGVIGDPVRRMAGSTTG